MPYKIVKKGSQFCTANKDTGKTVHCFPTRKQAVQQLKALYANVKDAKMSVHFSKEDTVLFGVEDETDSQNRHYIGKIFECGEYQDKGFSLNEAESDAQEETFSPVPVEIEHISTVFDGKLGSLETYWREGTEVFGELAVPQPVATLLGDKVKVSTTWNSTNKRLKAISLTTDPRVSDAEVFAAFSEDPEFAKKHNTSRGQYAMQQLHDEAVRHGAVCRKPANLSSRHEADAIQQIHDMAAEHGASCDSLKEGQTVMPYYFSKPQAEGNSVEFTIEEFKTLLGFGKKPEEQSKETPQETPKVAPATEPTSAFSEDALDAANSKAELKVAALFNAGKIVGAQREEVHSLYKQAYLDDRSRKPDIQFSGKPLESRVGLLDAIFSASPAMKTGEEIKTPEGSSILLSNTEKEKDEIGDMYKRSLASFNSRSGGTS